MKRFLYLPSKYKHRTNRTTEGRARTGEVSPKGLVSHVEDWEGRVAVEAEPTTMRYGYSVSTGKIRPLTRQEMIDRGYWKPGKGPKGFR